MTNEYFAGFFDADGSVCLATNNTRGTTTLQCVAYNSDKIVLEKFKQAFGGNIYIAHNYPERGWKIGYRWSVSSKTAREFLEHIFPYLIVKKERVKLAIRFGELILEKRASTKLIRNKKGHIINQQSTLSEDKIRELQDIKLKMTELNRRGILL